MKNILIFGGMAIAGFALFGRNKLTDIVSVGEKIQPNIKRIKNIKFGGSGITFNIDLALFNPTPVALDVSTGNFISLDKIQFFSKKGTLLGESLPGLDSIEVPASSGIVLTGIPVQISTTNVGELFSAVSAFATGGPAPLNYKLFFGALGKQFEINA